MRVDDYRFYAQLCRIFGIILLTVGILLPIFTTSWYTFLGRTYYDAPYLGLGIALVISGIILITTDSILSREYNIRKVQRQAMPVAPLVGYCPNCGTAREEGRPYCKKCGQRLP